MPTVTVAIPTLNGGDMLRRCLEAVRRQVVDRELEILICDSGSSDGSVEVARALGARVIEIPPQDFSHGGVRNLLMQEAYGEHVAFLTQDAEPESDRWLAQLLAGFRAAPGVALTYGPYRPRSHASPMVRRQLTQWFAGFADSAEPRVDRLPDGLPEDLPGLLGPVSFFTDANGCVARHAWERIPFRPVAYAEDHLLALDMLGAGYAKVYCPMAGVLHSHDYGALDLLRRSFDEWRALREIYGHVESAAPRRVAAVLRRELAADLRAAPELQPELARLLVLWRSLVHHGTWLAGALLGSRSSRIPPPLRRWLSLERRADFVSQHVPVPGAAEPR